MRKRILLSVAAVAAVTVTVVAYNRSTSHQTSEYLTAAVTRGSVVETVAATGTLQAVTTVQVGSQVSGTIKALHADYNSQVHKGEVIAELDPSLFQTQVEQARASLIKLQADADRAVVTAQDSQSKLKRAQELFQQQLISKQDLDTAEADARTTDAAVKSAQAQVTQARAALNQNQVNLDHTIIRAPIDGVVISRSVDVGQTVASSLQAPTLFVIANDLTRMQVSASIDEADIGQIAPKQPVTFTVDAYPGETFSGTVSQVRLEPKVESNVVSYTTIIDVPNPKMQLKPGMTATVTVEIARADDVLRVPTSALRFTPAGVTAGARATGAGAGGPTGVPGRNGGNGARADATGTTGRPQNDESGKPGRVWVLDDGQPNREPVKVGISDGATTAILDAPFEEGTRVITGTAAPGTAGTSTPSSSPFFPQRRGGARGQQQQGARGGGGR
ncbi:MAG TPA: efflux RND transporter periplasmic adaptor subunit [Vicinamibacterales bacterium]|nr:efflux RND transporter periplasmic adaptor subunit [Vicinamibacterales bacterium]